MPSRRKKPSPERQRNEELVIAALQARQPLSRRELADQTGISYPTVAKILIDLVATGVVSELDQEYSGFGRPGKIYRLAGASRSVMGLVIGQVTSDLVIAGCDGVIRGESSFRFATPSRFSELMEIVEQRVTHHRMQENGQLIGLGVTVPGLVERTSGEILSCPDIKHLEGKQLGAEFQQSLELPTAVVQSMHGLFLAERIFGEARTVDHFVLFNYSDGLGIAVCCNGQLMTGADGLAGEFGHMTVSIDGPACGCGNAGCLESFATDQVVAAAVSERLGRKMSIEEIVAEAEHGHQDIQDILENAVDYLAIGVATAVNLFNPRAVFLHGLYLQIGDSLFDRLRDQVRRRALAPTLERCRIIPIDRHPHDTACKGAVAAIVHQLTAGRRVSP